MRIVLVIPCYNEAKRFPADEFVSFAERNREVSYVLVNDGSFDGTAGILEDVAKRIPLQARVLSLRDNVGKAEAVRRGVQLAREAEPDAIGYWDSDLSTPLAEVDGLCRALDGNDAIQLAMGSRVMLLGRSIQRRMWRHYPGRVFATAVSIALQLPVYDTQCGAKLIRNGPVIPALFEEPFRVGWIFDVELLARLGTTEHDPRRSVVEHPLETWIEVPGSKLKPWDFVRAIGELWTIWRSYPRRVS